MYFNAQIAATILGFVSIAAAQPGHGHAHGHMAAHQRRQQFVQEGPDGEVFVPASGAHSSSAAQTTVSTTASATTSSISTVSAAAATPATPQSHATPVAGSSARQTPVSSSQQSFSNSQAASASASSKQKTASSGASATTFTTNTSKAEKSTKSATGPEQTTGDFTLKINNQYGTPLSLAYGNNAGAPGANGNPKNGMLSTSTTIVYPTGWAGRVTLGKDGNGAGSKIEGSYTGMPDIDVSYVDGYSVPIVCSCGNDPTPITGCNLELFDLGSCNEQGTSLSDKTCINDVSPKSADGPAPAFLKPCAGAAYTYPNDNDANMGCQSTIMECCIGTSCQAVPRQPGGKGNSTSS